MAESVAAVDEGHLLVQAQAQRHDLGSTDPVFQKPSSEAVIFQRQSVCLLPVRGGENPQRPRVVGITPVVGLRGDVAHSRGLVDRNIEVLPPGLEADDSTGPKRRPRRGLGLHAVDETHCGELGGQEASDPDELSPVEASMEDESTEVEIGPLAVRVIGERLAVPVRDRPRPVEVPRCPGDASRTGGGPEPRHGVVEAALRVSLQELIDLVAGAHDPAGDTRTQSVSRSPIDPDRRWHDVDHPACECSLCRAADVAGDREEQGQGADCVAGPVKSNSCAFRRGAAVSVL